MIDNIFHRSCSRVVKLSQFLLFLSYLLLLQSFVPSFLTIESVCVWGGGGGGGDNKLVVSQICEN